MYIYVYIYTYVQVCIYIYVMCLHIPGSLIHFLRSFSSTRRIWVATVYGYRLATLFSSIIYCPSVKWICLDFGLFFEFLEHWLRCLWLVIGTCVIILIVQACLWANNKKVCSQKTRNLASICCPGLVWRHDFGHQRCRRLPNDYRLSPLALSPTP